MRIALALTATLAAVAPTVRQHVSPLPCDLSAYRASQGLTAALAQQQLALSWRGEGSSELRARFSIVDGQPTVTDLAIRSGAGAWSTLGANLVPEYRVVTGVRRMSNQQADPLREAGVELTPDVVAKNRWYAFWDAPLYIPPAPTAATKAATARVLGPPRTPDEIHRAVATFHSSSCRVVSDGGSLSVTFPGLTMGTFAGDLRFTVYRGTNLIRMDAVAKTSDEWVAYKYDAGLRGFSSAAMHALEWRDTGGHPQRYAFGGVGNETIVPLKAQNRVLVAESPTGSIATW